MTSYTAGVADGTVTDLRTFALRCARAFGACMNMRDEPVDVLPALEVRPSPYLSGRLRDVQAALEAFDALTDDERQAHYRAALTEHNDREAARITRRHDERTRLDAMLAQVRAWTPPTSEHRGLKTFMEEQLTDTLRFQNYAAAEPPRDFPHMHHLSWAAAERERLVEEIAYWTTQVNDAHRRARETTAWRTALWNSLEG